MQYVRARLVALVVCGLCLATAWTVLELRRSGQGAQSFFGAAACVGSFVAGLTSGGLLLLPDRLWRAVSVQGNSWLERLVEVAPTMSTPLTISLVFSSGVAFLLVVRHIGLLQDLADNSDQNAYLQTASEIQHDGGVPSLVVSLMTGRFSEANRHPLYLALLSLWSTQLGGQLLSVVFGLVTIWGLAPFVIRKFGAGVATVYCTLLATNFACCYASTLVACESLMVFLATVGWLHFGLPETSDPLPLRSELQSHFGAGCCWGMLYLTKGTGLLWLAGYCLWLIVLPDRRVAVPDVKERDLHSVRDRIFHVVVSLALVVAGWSLVASPLLVRNGLRFGSLTYNVNSWLLFVDEYQDPNALAESSSLDEAARNYWESHSIQQIAERSVTGLVWEMFILVRSLGPTPLGESRILFGATLLVFAVIGLLAERRVNTLLLPIYLAIELPLFGWYVPVAASERFILPLVPPLLVFASMGIVRLAHVWWRERAHLLVAGGCFTWLIAWTLLTFRIRDLS